MFFLTSYHLLSVFWLPESSYQQQHFQVKNWTSHWTSQEARCPSTKSRREPKHLLRFQARAPFLPAAWHRLSFLSSVSLFFQKHKMGIIPLHVRGFITNQTTKTSMLLVSRGRGLVTHSRFYHAWPSLKWKRSALWCFHNIKQWWKWSWRKHSSCSPFILPGPVLLFLGDPTTCTLSRAFWDAKAPSAERLQLADCYFLSFRLTPSIYHWPNMDVPWVFQTQHLSRWAHGYLAHLPEPTPFPVFPSQKLQPPSIPLPGQKYRGLCGPTWTTTTSTFVSNCLKQSIIPQLSAGKQNMI